jgi:hypothetical protein
LSVIGAAAIAKGGQFHKAAQFEECFTWNAFEGVSGERLPVLLSASLETYTAGSPGRRNLLRPNP